MIAGMLNSVGAGLTTVFFAGLYFKRIGPKRIEQALTNLPFWLQAAGLVTMLQLGLEHYSVAIFRMPGSWLLHAVLWFSQFMSHEAGHIYFMLCGRTISVLGGTLPELLIPLSIFFYCLLHSRLLLGGFCLFFFGYDLHGVADYMRSALSMQRAEIVIYGTHDWKYLFDAFGITRAAPKIAELVIFAGMTFCTLGCLLFAAGMLLHHRPPRCSDPTAPG